RREAARYPPAVALQQNQTVWSRRVTSRLRSLSAQQTAPVCRSSIPDPPILRIFLKNQWVIFGMSLAIGESVAHGRHALSGEVASRGAENAPIPSMARLFRRAQCLHHHPCPRPKSREAQRR